MFFCSYLRRLECLTICIFYYKRSTVYSVIVDCSLSLLAAGSDVVLAVGPGNSSLGCAWAFLRALHCHRFYA